MRFCPLNHKNKQTIITKDNFNARYISVLSHWRTFETILTMESNVKLLMIGPPEQDGWVGWGGEGRGGVRAPSQSSLLMCPLLLLSPLNILFLKDVTKNVHEYQQAKSRAS